MNYEQQVRRSMEQAAAHQQLQPRCPVSEDVDAAFGPTSKGGEPTPPKHKGPAMKRKRGVKARLRN